MMEPEWNMVSTHKRHLLCANCGKSYGYRHKTKHPEWCYICCKFSSRMGKFNIVKVSTEIIKTKNGKNKIIKDCKIYKLKTKNGN